jgi:hypothetical protein
MSHDEKTWEEFNKLDESQLLAASLYADTVYRLNKKRGSNLTPPKKKRKKKK